MKKRKILFFGIIILVLVVSMACNLGKSSGSEDDEGIFTSEEGGFTFKMLDDYTINEILAGVEMTANDAVPEVGPGMQLFGSLTDQEQTTEEMWKMVTDPESSQFEFEKPKKFEVDDTKGLIAVFEGEQAGVAVKGKIFLVMVELTQQLMIFGIAPEEEWKEFEDTYNDVLDSVIFF